MNSLSSLDAIDGQMRLWPCDDGPDGVGDLLDGDLLQQVAVGARLDRLVEVVLLVADGEHEDLRRRHDVGDRPGGVDAADALGMRTSMSTTSGACSSALAMASSPSSASATTSMPSSDSSTIADPRRNSAWSSQIITLITSVNVGSSLMARLTVVAFPPSGSGLPRRTSPVRVVRPSRSVAKNVQTAHSHARTYGSWCTCMDRTGTPRPDRDAAFRPRCR